MILLCGIPTEPPLRYVIEAAEHDGLDFALFNQRDSPYTELAVGIADGQITGSIRLREDVFALEEFTGTYLRLMQWQQLPENQPSRSGGTDPQQFERSRLLHECLIDWTELTAGRVLNRMSATASNASKPFQALHIAAAGFPTIPTLITNEPEEVRSFLAAHGRVIFKSISSVRSIVCELTGERLRQLERIRVLPTQFQSFIDGINIRVHVVGDDVFPTEIKTDAVDYRYAGRDQLSVEMSVIQLPPEIEEKCIQLSKRLDLPLCGIDLKLARSGDYYCFEVNPSPAYSYYQDHTGQPIAQAIAHWLSSN